MKNDNYLFQELIQKYFLKYMYQQKNVSPETLKSYRDTFRLFIKYINEQHKISPTKITFEFIEAEYMIGLQQYIHFCVI